VHGVAIGGLLDVEIAHRVCTGCIVEQHIHVVFPVEIRHPDRGIVDCPIRFGEIIVWEIGEFTEHGPQHTFPIALQFNILSLGHLFDFSRSLAGEFGLNRLFFQLELLCGQGIGQIIIFPNQFWVIGKTVRPR
jgi:hypothetical protein